MSPAVPPIQVVFVTWNELAKSQKKARPHTRTLAPTKAEREEASASEKMLSVTSRLATAAAAALLSSSPSDSFFLLFLSFFSPFSFSSFFFFSSSLASIRIFANRPSSRNLSTPECTIMRYPARDTDTKA